MPSREGPGSKVRTLQRIPSSRCRTLMIKDVTWLQSPCRSWRRSLSSGQCPETRIYCYCFGERRAIALPVYTRWSYWSPPDLGDRPCAGRPLLGGRHPLAHHRGGAAGACPAPAPGKGNSGWQRVKKWPFLPGAERHPRPAHRPPPPPPLDWPPCLPLPAPASPSRAGGGCSVTAARADITAAAAPRSDRFGCSPGRAAEGGGLRAPRSAAAAGAGSSAGKTQQQRPSPPGVLFLLYFSFPPPLFRPPLRASPAPPAARGALSPLRDFPHDCHQGSRSAHGSLSPASVPGCQEVPDEPLEQSRAALVESMRDLHKSSVLGSKHSSLMSWRPQYRSSKFRNVYGKVASREHCFDGIPITKNVHDNHFCAVNARFLAIVTESAGGGSFLVIPLEQTGRIEPNYPKVCGHQGNVLDIKWNPFIENIIASCSEDTSVRIWEIPEGGLKRNMTEAVLELYGHSRRVGLVEWHPTTNNILFSAGYDYKVLIWNLDIGEPVKMIDCHTDVILCMSFNTDGSLLATTCKDKKLRVVEPRSGRVLQEASCKNHRVNRVVFLGSTKRLLTTGVSRWNTRQIALWDQEDLSMPLIEEEIDGLSGLLFPFYDADTHMLYLAGKGDGNIRYYEIGSEKPYLSYLMEFRSPAPQKGLGVMPKHGLDVSACEVFRFYKLVTLKGLIEPISMIVPRRSETYQEDIYPMTPGTEPALTPDEWLSGVNRDPILMSLKEGYKKTSKIVFKAPVREKKSVVVNGIDLLENVPPRTENELLRMFFRQQDEIRRLKDELSQKDIRIRQLQLELKNLRNSPKNN